jgi:hypothetical protein
VGITRQIGQHRFRSRKRAPGVHHPLACAHRSELPAEDGRIDERCVGRINGTQAVVFPAADDRARHRRYGGYLAAAGCSLAGPERHDAVAATAEPRDFRPFWRPIHRPGELVWRPRPIYARARPVRRKCVYRRTSVKTSARLQSTSRPGQHHAQHGRAEHGAPVPRYGVNRHATASCRSPGWRLSVRESHKITGCGANVPSQSYDIVFSIRQGPRSGLPTGSVLVCSVGGCLRKGLRIQPKCRFKGASGLSVGRERVT